MAQIVTSPIDITDEDLEAALGRSMTVAEKARSGHLSSQVIDAFEREAFGELANYGFGEGTVTQRLKSDGGVVSLPYRMVQEVISVTDVHGRDIPYTWNDWQAQAIHTRLRSAEFAVVTYDWKLEAGKATTALLTDAVARALAVPDAVRAGANQLTSSTGPFSQTQNFASWTVGGQALLSPEDKRAARAFRPRSRGHTWVMRS